MPKVARFKYNSPAATVFALTILSVKLEEKISKKLAANENEKSSVFPYNKQKTIIPVKENLRKSELKG